MKNLKFKWLLLSIILSVAGISQVWAGDGVQTVVYATCTDAELTAQSAVTIKINKNDDDVWGQYETVLKKSTIEQTFYWDNKRLFVFDFKPKYDGLKAFQMQMYNSSGSQVYTKNSFDTWTWIAHSYYRYKLYTWGDGCNSCNNSSSGFSNPYDNKMTMATGHVYYDATGWMDESKIQLTIGHMTYQGYYTMTRVPNTNLYYLAFDGSWSDALHMGFIGNSTEFTSDYQTLAKTVSANKFTGGLKWGLQEGHTNLFTHGEDNGAMPANAHDANSSTYAFLNNNQTIESWVNTGSGTYSKAYSKATIYLSSYEITGHGATTARNTSLTSSANSAYVVGCRRATTTLTIDDDLEANYMFMGWYDTEGNLLSKSTTYTYYPIGATTIHARFSYEESHSVTITDNDGERSETVGESTYSTVTAADKTDYVFSNWSLGDGMSIQAGDANTDQTIHVNTGGAGSAYTMTANYTLIPCKLIYSTSSGTFAYANKTGELTMSYDSEEQAYYYDITSTPTNPYYFRFYYNSTNEYSGDWNGSCPNVPELVANGSKHACATDVHNWVTNFATFKYTGAAESTIRIWYSKQEEKAWITEATYTITLRNGDHGIVSPTGFAMVGATGPVAIEATPNPGFRFKQWNATTGITVTSTTSASTTITATTTGTVTAEYTNDGFIYFDRSAVNGVWSGDDVYVTFFSNNDHWDNGAAKTINYINDAVFMKKMNRIPNTNIYYFDYQTAGYNPNQYYSFTDKALTSNYKFYSMAAVVRGDLERDKCNLFVVENYVEKTVNSTGYYYGYWMKYNEDNPGIKLNVWTSGGVTVTGSPFTLTGTAGDRQFTKTISLSGSATYHFKLQGDNRNMWYNNNGTMSSTNSTSWEFVERNNAADKYCYINTTADGDYKFTLNCSDKLYISVEYPLEVKDYRVVYTGKVKDKDGATSHPHPSDIIRHIRTSETKKDTVSFYVIDDGVTDAGNPANDWSIQLQRCSAISGSTVTWVNEGSAITASSFGLSGKKGVYQFVILQSSNDGGSTITASLINNTSQGSPKKYTGNFYIRTDVATGGWEAYKKASDNKMVYSEYAEKQSGYGFYHCHWTPAGKYMGFTIANDYNSAITDTMATDAPYVPSENLPKDANVRFMYDSITNIISRAYLSGSSYICDRFLVMEGNGKMFNSAGNALTGENRPHDGTGYLNENEINFTDDKNWLYEAVVKAQPGANIKLTGKYNNQIQYFWGDEGDTDADSVVLLGGTPTSTKYTIRAVYDFKTNRLMRAFIPDAEISTNLAIETDLMIIREGQGEAQQISFSGDGKLSEVKTVYGAMKLNKYTLNNKAKTGEHAPLDPAKSVYERDLYWISFPFDVNVNDIFGFGTYGKHWIIEYYDGKGRAKNGFWADSEPNWKFVTSSMKDTFKLNAYEGYILALDLDELTLSSSVWDNGVDSVYLYFPSTGNIDNIQATNKTVNFPRQEEDYKCIINRGTEQGNRTVKDSYWHCIGVPSFANYSRDLVPTEGGSTISWTNSSMPYLYVWAPETNTLTVTESATFSFQAMYSYLVQYAGSSIYWSAVNTPVASSVAARQSENVDPIFEVRLVLQQGDESADHTYIRLTEDANVTNNFDFNYDLCKEMNSGKANVYTIVEGYIQSAANCMPKPVQTTLVPVGVKVVANGEYTLSMPEGTNGEDVYLIDNAYGTRTNLGLMPYTITLTAGTYEGRFALEFGPIQDAPTGIEQMSTVNYQLSTEEVRKVFVGGRLYIIRDGKVYDAAGQRIE